MFTGLVQGVGRLLSRERRGADARLRFAIDAAGFDDLQVGESIAVDGACLTVVAADAAAAVFVIDVSPETLAITTLGGLGVGAPVNLERALRAGDRIGGHLVSGHVDGIGRIAGMAATPGAQHWRIEPPSSLLRYIATKGSICVAGVSLTVNAVDAQGCEVMLIPHTLAQTRFAKAAVGDAINLEVDMIARYLERLLQARDQA